MKIALVGLVALCGLTTAAFPAGAQKLISVPASEPGGLQAAAPSQAARDIRPGGPPIVIGPSGGTLIRLPAPARTVFIADAELADVQVMPQQREMVFITAKKAGRTALYAAGDDGEILLNSNIDVGPGPVTVIRRGDAMAGGQPAPGPLVLQIPLQPAPPAAR